MFNKKKQGFVKRHERELIMVLLVILIVSVIALGIILKAQGEKIKDTQIILQERAQQLFETSAQ